MEINFDRILNAAIDKLAIQKELENGPIPIARSDDSKLTVGQVFAILVNPIYTGIGPYPKIIEDELWINAMSKQIERLGVDLVLRVLLDSLRQTFDDN